MSKLPSQAEQQWIVEELAALIQRRGESPMVNAPIRLPRPEDFPDPWSPDLKGLKTLTQRILHHVGLDGYRLRLERFKGDASIDGVELDGTVRFRHHGAAAWFAGVRGREITFGCSERQLEAGGESLVGVMAHEVAHAYRLIHKLDVRNHDEEERLTDLTTVFFGFGVFTVNNTYRYRSYTKEDGAKLYSGHQTSRAGYLSPQCMSFAFAAQILLRELSCWQTLRLLRWLEPNQRGFTKAALRALGPADALRARLANDPPPVDLAALGVPGANRETED